MLTSELGGIIFSYDNTKGGFRRAFGTNATCIGISPSRVV